MTEAQLLQLHRDLVRIPSVSHEEGEIADFVSEFLSSAGVEVHRLHHNVIARTGRGQRLLLNSHLDTVPPNSSWTRDPWDPAQEDGRVYGLGSNDTKASVAAMIAAFLRAHESGGPCEVVLMLVGDEETGGLGTEVAWPWLRDELGWRPNGVVVGEPTDLHIGTAQKGLMILNLIARGTACHAANADSLGIDSPGWQLARDLVALKSANLGSPHPELGPTTLQVTMLRGAEVSNQVPGQASATLDIRTSPGIEHGALVDYLSSLVEGEIEPRSTRLLPYACPPDAAIVRAAQQAAPDRRTFASQTMSDQVFFQDVPTIKVGPGVSARSHSADEFVLESELLDGARFYSALIDRFAEVAS
ncbi:MAG: M20/M25/M40 family metallo-hydrolase [Chthonomonas sp.]|nr:M20/M25/M40 family metallo-hydrolase [Chthonomonas sp.]